MIKRAGHPACPSLPAFKFRHELKEKLFKITGAAFLIGLILFPLSHGGDFGAVIDSLNNLPIDRAREIDVDNLSFGFPHAILNLLQGKLYLTGYFNDKPTTAFFLGEGRFIYEHPDPIEKQQIERFYRSDSVVVDFDRVYIAFPWNSDFIQSIPKKGPDVDPSYRVKTLLKKMRSLPDKEFNYNLGFHLYRAAVDNRREYIWLDILKDDYQHTVYSYDPYSEEQVTLYKYTSNFKVPQLVSSTADSLKLPGAEFPVGFDNYEYNIDVDISTTAKSKITCTIFSRVECDSLKHLVFILPREYKVDTVWDDAVDFIKNKDRPELMLELNRFYHRGDRIKISVQYRTNLFHHYMQHGVVQSDLTHWYPAAGFRQLSDYTVRFSIDKGYDFICVGDKVQDTTIDGRQVMTYKTPRPVAYITFNYGKFETVEIDDTPVPINIEYYNGVAGSPIFGSPALNRVTEDISGAFRFYNDNFGPYPFDHLDVAAMAVGFGQGSAGVVHLSEVTFQRSEKGLDDKFRAHEVAHQWWGHLVNPAGYHDIWLSEGLAEYSAALYVQLGRDDESTFRKILKEWRKRIVQSGRMHGKKSVGYKAGAIFLGNRLASELSPGDFETIIYYKAAYLLHMLRFEMELEETNKNAFIEMLAGYADCYAGGKASTADFIDIAKPYLGDRTEVFFDQWLYDWRIPRIKKKTKKGRDDSYELFITVNEVGDRFETPYPVMFEMSDGSVDTIVYWIKSGENHFLYQAGSGLAVKSVEFNQNFDILER